MTRPLSAATKSSSSSLPVAPLVFFGFAAASIGGPIALPSLLPGAAGDGVESAGLAIIIGLALFAAPVAIWTLYSTRVASPGGLSAFVAAAAGRRVAVGHAWIWMLSYFLYLPYTVTYVVYDVLEPVFPGLGAYRGSLELILPVAIVLIVLSPVRAVLGGLALFALAQLGLLLALGAVTLSNTSPTLSRPVTVTALGGASAGVALLFICSSLPLYLVNEARGGSGTVRRSLVAAVAVVGVTFFLAGAPFAAIPSQLRDAAVPGAAIAQAYGGRGFGVAVGLATAASMLGLIVIEYLALGRVIHWLSGAPVRSTLAWIAVPFLAVDALSLLNPERVYNDLLKPSLVALYVSQLIVFLLFPRFNRSFAGWAAVVVASGLAAWGLYTV